MNGDDERRRAEEQARRQAEEQARSQGWPQQPGGYPPPTQPVPPQAPPTAPPGAWGAPTGQQAPVGAFGQAPPGAPPPGYGGGGPTGGGGSNNKGLLIGIGALLVVLLGVGGFLILGKDDKKKDINVTNTTDASGTTGTATDGTPGTGGTLAGQVTAANNAQGAVIQIVAQGGFVDPEFGAAEFAGAGSGFIIDPSGLAVTNNHVVTGAATLQVFIGGDDTPKNAQVIGTSECSDLAVIDIEGDGYPFFDFYTGAITPGLDVYLAGFPLGDPTYSLTKGIIQKAPGTEETGWASVDSVVEHDAEANPGNSGGPLLTEDGKVVGVHYAGVSETDQAFAITNPVLQQVVDRLSAGEYVDYIGINGQAVANEDGSLSGVWVSAVESGSAAGKIGIQGGDIITKMEGLSLATDGTMADYCDILRTQGATSPIAIQVLRFATEEVLQGTLNQDAFLTGSQVDDIVPDPGGQATYSAYDTIYDDSGVLAVEVPSEWSDREGFPVTLPDGHSLPTISAAPDLDEYYSNWSSSGMNVYAFPNPEAAADPLATLNYFTAFVGAEGACPTVGLRADPYDDGLYTGLLSLYQNCDGTAAQAVVIVAAPDDRSFAMIVTIQIVTDADIEALDHILQSFVYTP